MKKIIDNNVYRDDYEDLTIKLLFKKVDYDEAIEALHFLIYKDIF